MLRFRSRLQDLKLATVASEVLPRWRPRKPLLQLTRCARIFVRRSLVSGSLRLHLNNCLSLFVTAEVARLEEAGTQAEIARVAAEVAKLKDEHRLVQ